MLTRLIPRLILVTIFTYLAAAGATFNGLLTLIELQPITLGLFGLIVALWLVWHVRRGWVWHRSPFDWLFVLWGLVIALSIVANPQTWRRSVQAVWFVLLYMGVFFMLSDLLSNGGLKSAVIIDALLIVGFVIVLLGYWQIYLVLERGLAWARPVSTLGNYNYLGAFLLMIAPLTLLRAVQAKTSIARGAMLIYLLLVLILLLLTTSRGAWVGLGLAFAVFLLLWLADQGLLSPANLRHFWSQQGQRTRRLLTAGIVVSLLGAVGAVGAFFYIFTVPGRGAQWRTLIWQAALEQFSASPISGNGLFTYGYYLPTFWSIPPQQPHSHAHSIPFTILAELGLLGLLLLILTSAITIWLLWRKWQALKSGERLPFIALTAALIGFCGHHLFDTPAMMPLIALMGVLLLVMALDPVQPEPMQAAWRQRGHGFGMAGLWLVLLLVGFWHADAYTRYFTTLRTATLDQTYAEAAQALQTLIDADPRQPMYPMQQGLLWGLAAADGDLAAAQQGIASYEAYLALEPHQAPAWANLAALHWQLGNEQAALDAIAQARALAPQWQHFRRTQAIYSGENSSAEDIPPPASTQGWYLNTARFQYLYEGLNIEYVPQVGWGTR